MTSIIAQGLPSITNSTTSPATSATSGQTGQDYGLSMFFQVQVQGLDEAGNLGNWATCQGLGVTFTTDDPKAGGVCENILNLPGEIKYGAITLERAMTSSSTNNIMKWLKAVRSSWISGDISAIPKTINILLYDGNQHKVVTRWTLTNAIPTSWTGPSLSAKSGDVATEKLQLVHEGFLSESAKSANNAKLVLTELGNAANKVEFDYLPAHVSLVQTSTVAKNKLAATSQLVADSGQAVDDRDLALTMPALRIEGAAKLDSQVKQLFAWLEPKPKAATGAGAKARTGASGKLLASATPSAATPKSTAPPAKNTKVEDDAIPLRYEIGAGKLRYAVTLTKVDVKYTRFDPSGTPIRAEIVLTLKVLPKAPWTQGSVSSKDSGARQSLIGGARNGTSG